MNTQVITPTTFKGRLRHHATAAIATLSIAAFAALSPISAAFADTLRMYTPSDPASLDPAFFGTTTDVYLMNNTMPRLQTMALGDEWKLVNDVAETVDLSDPANITFKLKEGLQWANGYGELTAEDVKYSFERHKDPELGSYIAGEFDALIEVELTGKYSGIIRLDSPSVPMWQLTIAWTGGVIVSKKEALENGGKLPLPPKATLNAYTFAEFAPGERIVLKADPNWRGETPDFDEVVMIPVSDTNAAEIAFSAGELDFLPTTASTTEQLRKQWGDEATITQLPTIDFTWLGINAQHPNLTDPKLRRAIQLAIDFETLVDVTYEGMEVDRATGFAAPGVVGHREANLYGHDPEAARALIQEAGLEGQTVEIQVANYGLRSTQAQLIQAYLSAVGLNAEINAMDEATYWDLSAFPTTDRQITLKTWFGNPEVMYALSTFNEAGFDGWNWEGYASEEYDALMAQAYETPDPVERGAIYVKMQDMLEEAGTHSFVLNGPNTIVTRKGIVPGHWPDGRPVFHAFKKVE